MKRMATRVGLVGGGILIVFAIALAVAMPSRAAENTPVAAAARPVVRVARVSAAPATVVQRFPGVIESSAASTPGFGIGGRVSELLVDPGDRVSAGAPLARLEGRSVANSIRAAEASVEQARESLEQAQRDLDRVDRLGSAATDEEREQRRTAVARLEATLAEAGAGLEEARRRRDELTLTSPWDAQVLDIFVDTGDFVAAGTPALRVSRLTPSAEVDLLVNPESAAGLEISDPAIVVSPGGERAAATIRSRSIHAERGTGLVPVTLELDQPVAPTFVPGQPVTVELSVRSSDGRVVVPADALVGDAALNPVVFAVEAARVRLVPVRASRPLGNAFLVDAELEPGTPVVVSGHVGLSAGQIVEVAE